MIRRLTAVAATIGVLLAASFVHAQPAAPGGFGQQGQFILGADRLVPLFGYNSVKTGRPSDGNVTSDSTNTQTSFSLLWGSDFPDLTFYGVPRFGFDYVVAPNITVGGNLVLFATLGGSTTQHQQFKNGQTTDKSTDNPSVFLWGLAPRAGYILPMSDMLSLWLRGGPAYYHVSFKTTTSAGNTTITDTNSLSQFALALEPLAVFTPTPHFGITGGPTIDIPVSGSATQETSGGGQTSSTSNDYSQFHIGLSVGMIGWF